jgi:hypothetical protein
VTLIRAAHLLHNDTARVAMLSNLRIGSLPKTCVKDVVALVNAETCHILLPLIASSGIAIIAFLSKEHDSAVIASALTLFNQCHFALLPHHEQISLLVRFSEFGISDLSSSAAVSLSSLQIAGNVAADVLSSIVEESQIAFLIDVWQNFDGIVAPGAFVAALFQLLENRSINDAVLATIILKAIGNFKDVAQHGNDREMDDFRRFFTFFGSFRRGNRDWLRLSLFGPIQRRVCARHVTAWVVGQRWNQRSCGLGCCEGSPDSHR